MPSRSSASIARSRSRRSSRSDRGSPNIADQNPARRWLAAPVITFSSTVSPANRPSALERPRDAAPGQLVRPQPRQRPAAEADRPGLRADEAAQHVQQRRLAGAVGADDPGHLPPRGRERDVVQRREAAEPHRDPAHIQGRARFKARCFKARCFKARR